MTQSKKLTFYNWITKLLPDCRIVKAFRIWLLKRAGVKIGKNVELGEGVVIRGNGYIEIKDNIKIYDDVYILCKPEGKVVIGNNALLATRVYIECGGLISIGENTQIMQETLLTANCGSKLIVGRDSQIAHMVSLKTSTHEIDIYGKCIAGQDRYDNITIGNGVWLCAGVLILPGVSVGDNTIVAAGSVVTRTVEARCMVAGVPAIIKKRL